MADAVRTPEGENETLAASNAAAVDSESFMTSSRRLGSLGLDDNTGWPGFFLCGAGFSRCSTAACTLFSITYRRGRTVTGNHSIIGGSLVWGSLAAIAA